MIDPDTLKQAIELAPGWSITHIYAGEDWAGYWHKDWSYDSPVVEFSLQEPTKWGMAGLDALAAELVRLVDAVKRPTPDLIVHNGMTHIGWLHDEKQSHGPDRTANTINAIVQFARENPDVFRIEEPLND